MGKFTLAFGLHNHQPVGNFEAVFEDAHQKAYAPFIDLLKDYDNISLSLHQSGILWRWQERAHPEYFELIGSLVDAGRIELMTGGFYEPILTSIPERDIQGQIAMLNDYIESHFESMPDGLWLTERIWEPHLPKILAQAGVKYLPVDDTHFIYSGMELSQLNGPYVTEHENHRVTLLPISKRLRYLIPFGTIDKLMAELRAMAERDPEGMAIYADDGEKFGVWPHTHEHCYVDRWLPNFFDALAANSDWLEVVPLKRAAAAKPLGTAYLPSSSYAEMLHWSLPPEAFVEYEQLEQHLKEHSLLDRFGRFVRGGHWRGFLIKYAESNLMHKKMLYVSEKLATIEENASANQKTEIDSARDRLYAGQCNCPYWHGVFGGLYLPHIRQAVYGSLVEADHRLNQIAGRPAPDLKMLDYDADGSDEIVYDGDSLMAVFKPSRGGTLTELSMNKHGFSVTDTLTRRKEGYHRKIEMAARGGSSNETASIHDMVVAKEEGLERFLIDDWYVRRCLIDHFITAETDLEQFDSGRFGEEGDFVLEAYSYEVDEASACITLSRDGFIRRTHETIPVHMVKRIVINDAAARIDVEYLLSTLRSKPIEVIFAVENNFNFQAGHAEDRYILIDGNRPDEAYLDSVGRHPQARTFAMMDDYRGIAVGVTTDRPGEIWHLPLFTVSLSEAGFEKTYQGTTSLVRFGLRLSQEPVRLNLSLHTGTVEQLGGLVGRLSEADTRVR